MATFYTMYKRHPVGKYHVGVCTTALCAIMGGDEVFARLQDHLGIGNDETTEDGQITLEHLECNAACDFAPVMMVNWEFFDNMTPESALRRWSTGCGPASRCRPPAARRSAPGGRPSGCSPASPTAKADEGVDRGRTVAAGAEHRPGARLVRAAGAPSREAERRATRSRSRRPGWLIC